MSAEVDCDHPLGAHLAQGLGWDRMGEQAIHHHASIYMDRQKHSGIRATGAHRIDQLSFAEDHCLAGEKIGGGDGERDAQLFKGAGLKDALQ